jgi:hypothetical protein
MYIKPLADRVKFYKEEPEGVVEVCEAMERIVGKRTTESENQRSKKIALNLWNKGEYNPAVIAKLTELTIDQVREAVSVQSA